MVVLDGVQDPGNAGAIVRAAEAFGATGVMFLKGTVSPYNPKTLRASAGSLFRMPFVALDRRGTGTRGAAAEHGVDVYAAVPFAIRTTSSRSCMWISPRTAPSSSAAKARGVSDELRTGAVDVAIPTAGVESLNAAVAASVMLYEARRQRSLKPMSLFDTVAA